MPEIQDLVTSTWKRNSRCETEKMTVCCWNKEVRLSGVRQLMTFAVKKRTFELEFANDRFQLDL